MKIKWGALVVDGRGKIGGQVASKNKAGAYMRNKVTPTNPRTAAQTSARQLFGSITQGWSGLTDAVRSSWNEAVDDWGKTDIFGDLKNPTGKALFQRLNNQAQSGGYAAVTTPPARLEMVTGIVTAVAVDLTDATIVLTGASNSADARIMLFATASLSAGTSFVKNRFRLVTTDLASTYSATNAYTAYVAKFGEPAVGANVHFGIKYVLPNGQASPMQSVKASVTL